MKINKGNYTLTHEEALDTNGFLVDIIHFYETLPNGDIIEYQKVPTMKVRDYSSTRNMLDTTMGYTESELTEILEERIKETNK